LSPLLWMAVNFEEILNLSHLKQFLFGFLIPSGIKGVPFLEGGNGYSSFQYYLDYLKYHLALPVFILLAMAIFFLKNRGTYYRIIGSIFVIFFIQISFSTYRTDRLFLPVFIFAIFLMVYFFYFCYGAIKKDKLKRLVSIALIIFAFSVLKETVILGKSLVGKDTRYTLYKYLQKKLPRESKIFFLHLTIKGAYSTAQRLGIENWREYKIRVVYLSGKKKLSEPLSLIKGYFVLSAVDFNILREYYPEQYKALEKLLARSSQVTYMDKINYTRQPFGPTWMIPNSLYGIHNPPLFVYKTNNYVAPPLRKVIFDNIPYNLFSKKPGKVINISLHNLILIIPDGKGNNRKYNVNNYSGISWSKVRMKGGQMRDVLEIRNNTNSTFELYSRYLGKDKKGIDLGYGFAEKKFGGRKFKFSTWVKTDRKGNVSLGFYRGNIRVVGWGDSNLNAPDDKYELLYYESEFDQPYSLNGNIWYKISPNSSVKLTNPQFIAYDQK